MTRKKKLLIAWAILYITCTLWGFIPNPQGAQRGLLFVASLAFFIPPSILLYDAVQRDDRRAVRRMRTLCLVSLLLTTLVIILNFMTAEASKAAGKVLYWILIIVSTPMICSQVWVVPLFCWACLLMLCIRHGKKTPEEKAEAAKKKAKK